MALRKTLNWGNPAAAAPTTPTVQPPRQPGLIENVGKALIEPVAKYGAMVGEAAASAGRYATNSAFRKSVNGQQLTEQENERVANMKPVFMKEDQLAKFGTPGGAAKEGLKRTAGMAAMFIPAGKAGSLGKAALSGATSGALTGLSQGEDISAKNIFTGAVTGGVAAPAMQVFGKAVSKGVGKIGGKVNMKAAGEAIEAEGKDYAIRSARLSQSAQNKFKNKTGKEVADFMTGKNLYGQDLEQVDKLINPLQKARNEAIRSNNQMINPQQVIENFNAEIAALQVPGKGAVPANKLRVKALEEARDLFADDAVLYAQQTGDDSLTKYPLELLDNTRSDIDKATPAAQFMADPVGYGNSRKVGNVYRDTVNDAAGTKDVGLELRDLYAYRDALEKAPKGKGNLPFGLNKGVYGAVGQVASNLPFGVGAMLGMAGEAVANNPNVIGATSRGIQKVGKAMQGAAAPQLPQMPNNIFFQSLKSYAGKLPIAGAVAGVNGAMNQQPAQDGGKIPYQQFLQEQGVQDSEVAQFAYQNDITIQEAQAAMQAQQQPQGLPGLGAAQYQPNVRKQPIKPPPLPNFSTR